jgi:uncharacterized protein
MLPRLIVASCLLLGLAQVAAARPVGKIPDPRRSGSQFLDTTGRVDVETRGRVEALIAGARARGEILVVVTENTDGARPRAYATRLFNRLGIGARGRNDGVLLFFALDDRKAEIVLGDGLTVSTAVTDEIMAQQIVPRMKAKDLAGALTGATAALADRVLPGGSIAVEETRAALVDEPVGTPAGIEQAVVDQNPPESSSSAPWGFGLGGGALAAAVGRTIWRRHRRRCEKCRQKMVRLEESADDVHLSPAERMEESIRSVDYDLWVCNDCGTHRKIGWRAIFTFYGRCRSCNARTQRSRTVTLQSATTSSSGLAEVTETCVHCHHVHRYTRVIPRVSQSSSRSSSSGGGSSSGRGSSGSW